MNKLAIVAVAVVGLTMPAVAADLPVKAPAYRAPPAAVMSWTGCYIGANIGWGETKTEVADNITGISVGSHSPSGVVGGGQLGCDYQMRAVVFGVQGMFDGADIDGGHNDQFGNRWTTKTPWLATLTGRVGYAVDPATLLYVKGGGAWTKADIAQEFPIGTLFSSGSFTWSGWTVGGGLEHKFGPNWSVFAEYDYMDFGTHNKVALNCPTCGGPVLINTKLNTQVVLVGFNYRFTP